MPISKDDFEAIDEHDSDSMPDLSPDTTQGRIYRFLLENADKAFRQREIIAAIDVPDGSVGPTLKRLEERNLVEHRDRYWAIADAEHAVASAAPLATATLDELDGGFSDEDVDAWMETAVDPISERDETAAEDEGQ